MRHDNAEKNVTVFQSMWLPIMVLSLLICSTFVNAQIIFTSDTVLTGTHEFYQSVGVYDSTVTVTIEFANIAFHAGLTIERGTLRVFHGSSLIFHNGYGISMARNARLEARHNSTFHGTDPIGISFWNSRVYITDCDFAYASLSVMETYGDTITTTPSFTILNSRIFLDSLNTNKMIFSQGVNIQVTNCSLEREGDNNSGPYPAIHMQSNKYSRIEDCNIEGGISAGSLLNSAIEIVNNTIDQAEKGISFWGVQDINYNIIQNVGIGIEGGTISNKVDGLRIQFNDILNVSERAINVVGDSILINKNKITGNGETGKGLYLTYSSGSVTNNHISSFQVGDSSLDIDGIALYVKNSTPSMDIRGNIIQNCGMNSIAPSDVVSSIVFLESGVKFISNELRLNTLGGHASPTYSFAGGPVVDVLSPATEAPVILRNNLFHSNIFVGTGVYQPTGTYGTLMSVDFDTHVEIEGNFFRGDRSTTLGLALFPNFPNGVVGDSLWFKDNVFTNNMVGVGTMQAPDLGDNNIFMDNDYHIMRYGGYIGDTLYALHNNWDDDDSVWIDLRLFDDEEGYNTGPVDFRNFFHTPYNVSITYPPLVAVSHGNTNELDEDSLVITALVTDDLGAPVADKYVFFSSADPDVARFYQDEPKTAGDGTVSGILHKVSGGTTSISVFAGDTVAEQSGVITAIGSDHNSSLVGEYRLEQNFPNPFNPVTKIGYELPAATDVTLKVFNMVGQEVATLVNEHREPGRHEVEFDGSKLPSGVYFCRIHAGTFTDTRKLVLLR